MIGKLCYLQFISLDMCTKARAFEFVNDGPARKQTALTIMLAS